MGEPKRTPSRWKWPLIGLVAIAALVIGVLGPRLYGAFSLLNSGDEVDVGGRTIFVRCIGSGQPTVLLEHGLGSSGHEWQAVQGLLADTTRVCFTSRAGMGFSDAAAEPVRTAQDAVADLSRVLSEAGIDGPYVLVGHSFGGLVVRLFAAAYPDEVDGIVLVDSAHEEQTSTLRRKLSAASWEAIAPFFEATNPERMDFGASSVQVAAVGPLGELPLEVLEAGTQETSAGGAGVPESVAAEIDTVMAEHWPLLQEDLVGLSSDGHHEVVPDSSHFIHVDQPETVARAIQAVLER